MDAFIIFALAIGGILAVLGGGSSGNGGPRKELRPPSDPDQDWGKIDDLVSGPEDDIWNKPL